MLTASLTTPGQGVSFSTRSLAPGDRAAAWERVLSQVFMGVEVAVDSGRPWAGQLTAERLGALQVATEEFGPGTILRSARTVAAAPGTHILVRLQLEGTALLLQDGRTAELRPGRMAFHDARRPYRIVLPQRQRARVLMLPRALLRLEEGQLAALTATAVDDTGEGAAALLMPLLRGLVDEVVRADTTRRDDLARIAAEILATLALEQVGSRTAPALWERITASVRARLQDPGLTPQDIADQHGISLRYLHRLFQLQGTTVNAWVRTRRLEAARDELARAGAAHRSIAAVAARWGFTNASHFSRTFRETYGMSPVQWRGAHAGSRRPDGAVPGKARAGTLSA
ncbi:helix-turn-helix domain-containing protein [Streptomyces sp. NPDC020800]|uniref:helix-turn-helix domain-containing protein n=1 Tax=Streptomyces sp. NPDC020800 TaxID=3365092 RepID=UPI0037B80676